MSLRDDALAILAAGLRAADPYESVRSALADCTAPRVWIVGAGKASARMAEAAEDTLGDRVLGGWVNTKDGHLAATRRVTLHECSHPMPDARGVAGSEAIARIATQAGAGDLLLCLISGGASALMPLPAPGVTLSDKQAVTSLLLACGATIHEINCVRKHLSAIKGGRLARLAAPAPVLTLILSDVIGDNLDVIGSGPTVPDPTTFADARAVLERYALWFRVPDAVRHAIERGEESPKPGDAVFAQVENRIIGSNRLAAEAAQQAARTLGHDCPILSTEVQGEARDVAVELLRNSGSWIAGGETTVTLRGNGKGGRNQEMALAAAMALAGQSGTVFLSAGTDGTDGPTDAAGAIADGTTLDRAATLGLDAAAHLADNDSYPYFDALGDLIRTGPTGTNVADLQICLRRPVLTSPELL